MGPWISIPDPAKPGSENPKKVQPEGRNKQASKMSCFFWKVKTPPLNKWCNLCHYRTFLSIVIPWSIALPTWYSYFQFRLRLRHLTLFNKPRSYQPWRWVTLPHRMHLGGPRRPWSHRRQLLCSRCRPQRRSHGRDPIVSIFYTLFKKSWLFSLVAWFFTEPWALVLSIFYQRKDWECQFVNFVLVTSWNTQKSKNELFKCQPCY